MHIGSFDIMFYNMKIVRQVYGLGHCDLQMPFSSLLICAMRKWGFRHEWPAMGPHIHTDQSLHCMNETFMDPINDYELEQVCRHLRVLNRWVGVSESSHNCTHLGLVCTQLSPHCTYMPEDPIDVAVDVCSMSEAHCLPTLAQYLDILFSRLLGWSATDKDKFSTVQIWHTKFGMVQLTFLMS